jgi:K+-sensing histidine kinase KdpD
VIAAWSAALLCIVSRGQNGSAVIPLAFLVIVILVALRFGAMAGMLGSASAAVIFAFFLYHPAGIGVEDPAARMNLAWLVLGGLACSYLLAPEQPGSRRQQ